MSGCLEAVTKTLNECYSKYENAIFLEDLITGVFQIPTNSFL